MRNFKRTPNSTGWLTFFVLAIVGLALEALDIKYNFVVRVFWEPISNFLTNPHVVNFSVGAFVGLIIVALVLLIKGLLRA